MELQSEHSLAFMLDHRVRGSRSVCQDAKASRQLRHRIPVAHPNLLPVLQSFQQPALFTDRQASEAIFPCVEMLGPAAIVIYHQLHAVTDAQDGYAKLPDDLIRPGGVALLNAEGAAGKYHRLG